jgi:putative ABC transport system permease protein
MIALRYLSKRKLRTALTTLAIVFGVSVIFGAGTMIPTAQRGFEMNALAQGTAQDTGQNQLQFGGTIIGAFGMLGLFVGGFLIFNTLRTAVAERQADLAVLRAIGADRLQITSIILIESLLQGVIGTGIGLVAGYLFGKWLLVWTVERNILPIGTPTDPIVTLQSLALTIALGLGTTLLAGYIPAYRAGRVSPLAALRPTTPMQAQRVNYWSMLLGGGCIAVATLLMFSESTVLGGGLLLLLGAVVIVPALVRRLMDWLRPLFAVVFPKEAELAWSNIIRQPGRTAVTVSTLMIGCAIFIACMSLVQSMGDFFVRAYTQSYVSDALVLPPGNLLQIGNINITKAIPVPDDLTRRLRESTDIAAISGLRTTRLVHNNKPVLVVGIEPLINQQLRPLTFIQGDINAALSQLNLDTERTLLVTPATAKAFGVSTGDTLPLNTPHNGPQVYRVVGLAEDLIIPIGTYGFILSQGWLAQDFGVASDVVLFIKFASSAQAENVWRLLNGQAGILAIDTAQYRAQGVQQGLTLASFFYILAAVVLAPTILGLVNTLIVSVIERKREIGLFRAIGADRDQVLRTVMVEAVMLGSLSAPLGIITGVALSAGFVQMWRGLAPNIGGGLYLTIPPHVFLTALIGGLVVVLLASAIPARFAARQEIVQSLRYE